MNTLQMLLGNLYFLQKDDDLVDLSAVANEKELLLDDAGHPRFIKVYDNEGMTIDRYSILFTRKKVDKYGYMALKLSETPDDQYHNQHHYTVKRPRKRHVGLVGKPIAFESLPKACQEAVHQHYKELWGYDESSS